MFIKTAVLRKIRIIVFICIIFAINALPEAYSLQLKEISNNEPDPSIELLDGEGYLKNYGGSPRAPGGNVTYAEFISMTCQMLGLDGTKLEPSGHWAEADMEYATFRNWVTKAEIPSSFYDKPISRELAVRIAMLAFCSEITIPGTEKNNIKIADKERIDISNLKYVELAYSLGLLKNSPGNLFRPKDDITLDEAANLLCGACSKGRKETNRGDSILLPILMYHNIAYAHGATNPEKFRRDMVSLKSAGFNTIFYSDLYDYVVNGKTLPQKPIIISFDDGYYSNFQYAYHVLKQFGMKAEISIIGNLVGVKNAATVIPHFSWSEAREMYDAGVIHIQSHSFNMHEYNPLGEVKRRGVLKKPDESYEQYINAFANDTKTITFMIEQNMGYVPLAYTYPYGLSTMLDEKMLQALGYKMTITTKQGINKVTEGDESTLMHLNRISADGLETDIVEYINQTS